MLLEEGACKEIIKHAMKIVDKALENTFRKIVTMDDMQFGLVPGKRTVDTVFILKRIQKEYIAKEKKLYMCFADEKNTTFNRVPRKVVEWAMKKTCIPQAFI